MENCSCVGKSDLYNEINFGPLAKFVAAWVIAEFLIMVSFLLWKTGVLFCCRTRVHEVNRKIHKKMVDRDRAKKHRHPSPEEELFIREV